LRWEVRKVLNQIKNRKFKKEFIREVRDWCEEEAEDFAFSVRGELINEHSLRLYLKARYNLNLDSLDDVEKILNPTSKEENVKYSSDSKNVYIEIFANSLVLKLKNEKFVRVYFSLDEVNLDIKNWVVVENSENFKNINENVVYLGGKLNRITKKFLKDKEVLVFVDFDIEGMNIYESIEAKKELFVPKNIEELINVYGNYERYYKQRNRKKENYSKDAKRVIELIEKYKKGLDQEKVKFEN